MFDEDPDKPSLIPPAERPLTIPAAVLWFLVAMMGSILLIAVTTAIRPGSQTDLVNAVACQAAAYVLALTLLVRIHAAHKPLTTILGLRGTHPLFYPLAALLGLSLQVPAELLQRLVFKVAPMDPKLAELQAEMLRMDTTLSRIMIPLAVIVVGPVVEEAFFRGALFSGLRQRNSAVMSVVVVSALFAGAHYSIKLFIPLFVVGAVVTLLRSASGSLWPPLIAHLVFNAVTVVAMGFGWVSLDADPEPLPVALSIGGVITSLVLLGAMLALSRRSDLARRAQQQDSS
ncbi:MAG: CPBP family intramembrane glutamic endopeptidase [Myxococcota bacterium]